MPSGVKTEDACVEARVSTPISRLRRVAGGLVSTYPYHIAIGVDLQLVLSGT
jgi:hypothetical protein